MKKSEKYLFKIANVLYTKYAESQSLQEIIENASKYGEGSSNGIMDYTTQLDQDKADLSLDVTVTFGTFGLSVKANNLQVDPSEYTPRYTKLPGQIEKYLKKYIKSFPQILPNETYTISYSGNPGSQVANR